MIIAIEGLDSSGKATQSAKLVDHLLENGHPAVLFSFPRYNTPLGAAIKRLLAGQTMVGYEHSLDSTDHRIDGDPVWRHSPDEPMVIQTMMTTDKYDALPDIEALVLAGTIVVCDRWKPSAITYGAADGLSTAWLHRIQEKLPDADLNIFLSVSPAEALRRRPQLRDRYEKDRAKQQIISEHYTTIWSDVRSRSWVVVDGESAKPTKEEQIDEVHTRVWRTVKMFALKGAL